MRFGRRNLAVLLCAAATPAMDGAAEAATPAPGFKEEVVASNLTTALDMAWAPDGRMFFVEKRGVLKVRTPSGTVRELLNISDRVNSAIDRGLTGVAVDVNFAANGYVYLLYTYDPFGGDRPTPKTSRLTRITINPDGTVANRNTAPETVILGTYQPAPFAEECPAPNNLYDCIPADGTSHVNGTVVAAPDGTLFVGTGDAMYQASNSPDPFRPLYAKSLAGKILRVDRNGRGVAGHPFCPSNADLSQACTKVYAAGFRNPFRFNINPAGGVWAGDVGAERFEELDRVTAGGSYGWPCYEGPETYAPFASVDICKQRYAAAGTASAERFPAFFFARGDGGAIIGGPQYTGNAYPTEYRDSVFWGDVVQGRLERVEFDSEGKVLASHPFADGWHGVSIRQGPDGYIYTAEFNRITRFVPITGNRPPSAAIQATPNAGLAPLQVQFASAGSSDPDGDELTFTWDFGDGTSGTGSSPVHSYIANGRYTVKLTVSDPMGATGTAQTEIVVGDRPPVLTVNIPTLYSDGETVSMTANATDPEDGTLPDEAISWKVTLQHNTHFHSVTETTGRSASFTALTEHDSDSHYLIDVEAVDSQGVKTAVQRRIDPRTVQLTLAADPPGGDVELFYNSVPHRAPWTHTAAVGFETTVVAPVTMRSATGETLVFSSWSDGGARTHAITVPNHDLTLTARYVRDDTAPETTLLGGPEFVSNTSRPTFTFEADEPTHHFDCRMDGKYWFTCASPWKSPALTNKTHVFEVRAIDLAGNIDYSPARRQFMVAATDQ